MVGKRFLPFNYTTYFRYQSLDFRGKNMTLKPPAWQYFLHKDSLFQGIFTSKTPQKTWRGKWENCPESVWYRKSHPLQEIMVVEVKGNKSPPFYCWVGCSKTFLSLGDMKFEERHRPTNQKCQDKQLKMGTLVTLQQKKSRNIQKGFEPSKVFSIWNHEITQCYVSQV